ncbi:hypothetical protein [Paenibacillus sp. sgz500958]|uniref:hypothetical protein n=1 Tax=Paenibacillus sp. sgz500958 TaxID=3242475 RepID=UPI0036D3C8DA
MNRDQIVEIVYLDKHGKITQRNIRIREIKDGVIRATCLATNAPRVFRVENILAWRPAKIAYAV